MKPTRKVRDALRAAGIDTPAPSKYGSRKVTVGGVVYDSQKEAQHGLLLASLERDGLIRDLRRQFKYPLVVNGVLVCSYFADFTYVDCATGETVVCDVKSEVTKKIPAYRIKKKLMRAVHGIEVKEV